MLGVFFINKHNTVDHASSVVRYLGFFAYWYLLLEAAATGRDLLAVALGLLLAAAALAFSRIRRADVKLLVVVLLLGPLVDIILIAWGLVNYHGWTVNPHLPPLWIYACWANFALMANHGLQDLFGRTAHAALLGLVAGPLAFGLGVYWNAAAYPHGAAMPSLVLAIGWSLILARIFRSRPRELEQRHEQHRAAMPPPAETADSRRP